MKNTPYWKLFILSYIAFTIFSFIICEIVGDSKIFTHLVNIKIGLSVSIFTAIIFTLTTNSLRSSDKFWRLANEVETKLDNANSKDELKLIYDNELEQLKKLAGGSPHYYEVKRLYTIANTKYKFVH